MPKLYNLTVDSRSSTVKPFLMVCLELPVSVSDFKDWGFVSLLYNCLKMSLQSNSYIQLYRHTYKYTEISS